jgi:hypothetical protein
MIEDMLLSGFQSRTQETYVKSAYALAAFYRRSPDQLTEEEVRAYLLDLKSKGVARGTFKTSYYGLRFLYCQTLNKEWALFGKKRSVNLNKNGCLSLSLTSIFATF